MEDYLSELEFTIHTIDDEILKINQTQQFRYGKRMRIPEKGMNFKNIRGDLIVNFIVDYPLHLSSKQIKELKKILN